MLFFKPHVLLLLLLAGCGFTPLLRDGQKESKNLPALSVEAAENQWGYLFKRSLLQHTNSLSSTSCILTVKPLLVFNESNVSYARDQIASRLRLTATLTLKVYDQSQKLLLKQQFVESAFYNIVSENSYASLKLKEFTQANLVRLLAKRVYIYLLQHDKALQVTYDHKV